MHATVRAHEIPPATSTAPARQYARTHYLIVGLALGALWLLNRDRSLLFHTVQMLGLMSVLTALQIVLIRHAAQVPPYARLIIAKLVLVAVAVGAQWLLAPRTSRSNAIVAAGLFVLITVLGPILDRLAARRALLRVGPRASRDCQDAGCHTAIRRSAITPLWGRTSSIDPVVE